MDVFPNGRVTLQHYQGELWEVAQDFVYYWIAEDMLVTTPKGVLTDQASIGNVIPPFILNDTGCISNGAVPHDYIYECMTLPEDINVGFWMSRRDADRLFRDACMDAGLAKWRAWLAYVGVRVLSAHRSLTWRSEDADNSQPEQVRYQQPEQ